MISYKETTEKSTNLNKQLQVDIFGGRLSPHVLFDVLPFDVYPLRVDK